MGLLLMLFVLVAAVAVIGVGAYTLDLLVRENNQGPVSGPTHRIPPLDVGDTQVGGYSLLSGADADAELELPEDTIVRVRQLVASDRTTDAVRLVREQTGVGVERARRVVDWIADH